VTKPHKCSDQTSDWPGKFLAIWPEWKNQTGWKKLLWPGFDHPAGMKKMKLKKVMRNEPKTKKLSWKNGESRT